MTNWEPIASINNRLWIHLNNESRYLSSVRVDSVNWTSGGESVVVIEGRLSFTGFLLDIQDKSATFEVLTGKCGDPTDYKSGKRLMLMKNLRSFSWWTDSVMSWDENSVTNLCCQFTCDWVEICDL